MKKTLEEDKKAVEQLRTGKTEAIQFLIGKILSLTKRQADPKEIKNIIMEEINKELTCLDSSAGRAIGC